MHNRWKGISYMEYFDYVSFVCERINKLRTRKGVSARDMSLSLGQSTSYINKIENRRTLPSLPGLIYIFEYFNITPMEFFDTDSADPNGAAELLNEIKKLSPEQADHVMQIVRDILNNT